MKSTSKPVVFDKKWFNPLYFILNDLAKDPTIRIILVYGGKSSSKSVSICQFLSKECYVKGANSIGFRKESAIIPTTLKKTFDLAIEKMYLYPAFESQLRRYLCENKDNSISEIVLKGLDDEGKAKGVESYQYVYLDELDQFEHNEYTQVNLSLRGIPGQKIFASWNPVDKDSWVKTKLVDKYTWGDTDYRLPCVDSFVKRSTCGKVVLIKTEYEDNYWIAGSPDGSYGYRDENLIAEYEALQFIDINSYNVNVKGKWGTKDPNMLFARDFVVSKHVGRPEYNPSQDIYLSFDLNYDPTAIVIQAYDKKIRVLKEYHNKGDILPVVLNQFLHDYPGAFVIINGDNSGNHTKNLTDHSTSYDIIKNVLNISYDLMHVPKANPSHLRSRMVTNLLLKHYDVLIHEDCKELILDIETATVDEKGSLDPWKAKNPHRSHWLDAWRYHLYAEHSSIIKELQL